MISDLGPNPTLADHWRVLNDLRSLASKARIVIVTGNVIELGGYFTDDGNNRQAQLAWLDGMQAKLDRLGESGDLGRGLADGSFDEAHWLAVLNAEGQGLNSLMRDAKLSQWSDFWTDVVVKTAADVKQNAENAVKTGAPWVVVMLVLLVAFQVLRLFR